MAVHLTGHRIKGLKPHKLSYGLRCIVYFLILRLLKQCYEFFTLRRLCHSTEILNYIFVTVLKPYNPDI